jgi:hypothetical protein
MNSSQQVAILAGLRELSDVEFQRRVWLSTGAPEVSSFSETVCQLFDDTGLEDLLDRGPVFSPELDEGLRELSAELSRIDSSAPPEEIIESSAMQSIRRKAQVLHDRLADLLCRTD